MRVIGGKYKRRLLASPPEDLKTRPTKDRVREAIFSALQNEVEGAVVLDLFAGSGALGIEALSREASEAVFVDVLPSAIATIKHNLSLLGIDEAIVMQGDYQNCLTAFKEQRRQFSLVFLDPPYAMDVTYKVIVELVQNDLLTDSATIVVESDHPLNVEDLPFTEVRRYRYGFIYVTILRR